MSDAIRSGWPGRLRTLQDYCAGHDLDALVVSTPANLAYLTGFTGSAALLVCTRDEPWLLTDGRYEAAVRQDMANGQVAQTRLERAEPRYDLALAARLERLHVRRAGFEASHVTVATLRVWQGLAAGIEWAPTEGVVERQRLIKDDAELAIFRRAGPALAGVARQLSAWVRRGRSEREVAGDIEAAIERAGFSQPAFPTIVAAGPNSALPHARPTDRRLGNGDLVVLDFGGVLDGYCVDLTRMAGVGQVGPEAVSLFEAVKAAQTAALAAIRSGVSGSDVDAAARQVLDGRGFGPAFLHSTGHGLGREVHEAPRLSRAESGGAERLEAGMVCTIEPGAYVEGLGGARLEDDVIVTTGGCEVLTEAPRDLLIV
jgi:Xaa-Pro aminopeptidase